MSAVGREIFERDGGKVKQNDTLIILQRDDGSDLSHSPHSHLCGCVSVDVFGVVDIRRCVVTNECC